MCVVCVFWFVLLCAMYAFKKCVMGVVCCRFLGGACFVVVCVVLRVCVVLLCCVVVLVLCCVGVFAVLLWCCGVLCCLLVCFMSCLCFFFVVVCCVCAIVGECVFVCVVLFVRLLFVCLLVRKR